MVRCRKNERNTETCLGSAGGIQFNPGRVARRRTTVGQLESLANALMGTSLIATRSTRRRDSSQKKPHTAANREFAAIGSGMWLFWGQTGVSTVREYISTICCCLVGCRIVTEGSAR